MEKAEVKQEEPPVQMDFEAALSLLKKNKQKKAEEKEKSEEPQNEEIELPEDDYETFTTSSGRKFRSKIQEKGHLYNQL